MLGAQIQESRLAVPQVLITVDVEFWPVSTDRAVLEDGFARNIMGIHSGGEHGLRYQLDSFSRHGLKAVCFVEALSALAVGPEWLRRTVDLIVASGHEVQLHVHPEWLAITDNPPVPHRGPNMKDYSEDEQTALLQAGLGQLHGCGVEGVSAFRAGNYGADNATLRALAREGLKYDSSYNHCYLGGDCGIDLGEALLRPAHLEGITELPISYFEDLPGHARHAQICAASFAEMRAAIEGTAARGWETFVMVSHGFELLNAARSRPNPLLLRRFEKLCGFLEENVVDYPTAGFNDLHITPAAPDGADRPLSSNLVRTGLRVAEQALGRLWG